MPSVFLGGTSRFSALALKSPDIAGVPLYDLVKSFLHFSITAWLMACLSATIMLFYACGPGLRFSASVVRPSCAAALTSLSAL